MKHMMIHLREYADQASTAEKTIIKYVLQDPEQVANLSIHELSRKTYASSATILRLCRKLGMEGYTDFRLALSYELALWNKSIEQRTKKIGFTEGMENIVTQVASKNITSLEDSLALLDLSVLTKAVDQMHASKMIVFYGIGSSHYVACDAYLKLLRLGKPCMINSDSHTQLVQARNMTPDDLGFVISYSGNTTEMIDCVKAMRENDSPIISITRYGVSPISERCTYPLYVAANEALFRNGAMSSRLSQLNLIDILYTAYASRAYDDMLQKISKTHIEKPGHDPMITSS